MRRGAGPPKPVKYDFGQLRQLGESNSAIFPRGRFRKQKQWGALKGGMGNIVSGKGSSIKKFNSDKCIRSMEGNGKYKQFLQKIPACEVLEDVRGDGPRAWIKVKTLRSASKKKLPQE